MEFTDMSSAVTHQNQKKMERDFTARHGSALLSRRKNYRKYLWCFGGKLDHVVQYCIGNGATNIPIRE